MSDSISFEVEEGWGQLPEGWTYGHVIGVAVDSKDRVYVFCRGGHPVIIHEQDGSFVKSWGEGVFKQPHGIHIHEDTVYCTDVGDHTVRKFTLDGELLRTWGKKDVAGDEVPFNRPADVAFAHSGEMYVADGYGNSKVHKYSKDGDLLLSWGEPGDGPSQFEISHDVWVHMDGRVFVADRQNNRIQIFTPDGEYIEEWTGLELPCSLYFDEKNRIYVTELTGHLSILDIEGNLMTRWGKEKSHDPGMFVAPHCTWTDSKGDLYVGETLEGSRIQKFIKKKG